MRKIAKAGTALGLFFLLASMVGCGANRYQVHTGVARGARSVIDQGVVVYDNICTEDEYRAMAQEDLDRAEVYRERCVLTHDSIVLSIELWETYVTIALMEGLDAPGLLTTGGRLLDVWQSVRDLVKSIDEDINLPGIDL